MSDKILACSSCGVKLKLKEDRELPRDAQCPKCQSPLFEKKPTRPVPASPSASKPTTAGTKSTTQSSSRPVSPMKKRPPVEEVYEDDFEVEAEDDFFENDTVDVLPRRSSRKRDRSSDGIPGWLIGTLTGIVTAGLVLGGMYFFLPRGGSGGPTAPDQVVANTNPSSPTLTTTGAPSSPSGSLQTGPSTGTSTEIPVTSAPTVSSGDSPQSVGGPTTPVPTAPVSTPQGRDVVKYSPAPESRHFYRFEIVADFEKYREKTDGSCMLTTEKEVRSRFSVRPSTPEQGTGSGFVIGADGLIATCAHVVDDASTIEVVVNGQTFPARVLHSDETHDLAILKIEASGLSPVTLSNSDQLQLGQPLRVIGFPLSDVLGTGIKIAQGAVSGIIEQDGQRRIQTDAAINPGNSGGPVFNTRGEVIGVASAKLAGVAVSQVGFCVPSNTLATIIQQAGLPLPPNAPGQEMEATALVQKATPSVVFVKVSGNAVGEAAIAFDYSATIHSQRETRDGLPVLGGGFSLPTHDSGHLSLTDHGAPVDMSDGEFAPIVMSRLPLLPFAELSKSGQSNWSRQREISIVREERSRSPLGSRRALFEELFPDRKPKVVAVQKARETEKFHIESDTNEQLVVSRTYELKTTDGSEPGIELTGSGKWTFDRTMGMPSGSEMKGTYKVTVGGVTITIPYTVSVSHWTKEEMEKFNNELAAAAKEIGNLQTGVAPKSPEAEAVDSGDATFVIRSKLWGYKTVAISPDGKQVASTDQNKVIRIHDLATGKEIDSKLDLEDLGTPSRSAYTPDGKYLLVGGYEGVIRIWSIDDKGEIDRVGDYVGHASDIEALEILKDSRTVISSDQKKRVRVWTLEDQKDIFTIADLKKNTCEIGVSADGKTGLLFAPDSTVTSFSLNDGKVISSKPVEQIHFGQVALFSEDGKSLFFPKTYEIIIQGVSGKKSRGGVDLGEIPWALSHCLKTQELVAGGSGKVHIIDVKKQSRTGILSTGKDTGYVQSVEISPDGRYVVAIGGPIGQALMIFDRQVKTGDPRAERDEDADDSEAESSNDDESDGKGTDDEESEGENPFKVE